MKCKQCNQSVLLIPGDGLSKVVYKKRLVHVGTTLVTRKEPSLALFPIEENPNSLCYYCQKKAEGLIGAASEDFDGARWFTSGPALKQSLAPQLEEWLTTRRGAPSGRRAR